MENSKEYRVYGPPGTGKTTYLSKQIRAAVQQHGSDAVFVASFTRAAAAELAGRDLPLDRSRIGTLHAHCYRSIGDVNLAETNLDEWNKEHPGFEVGETRKDMDDPYAERRQGSAGDESLSVVQTLRAQMVRDELWPVRARNFFDRWTKWKHANDLLDFTDLLEIALMEFDVAPGGPTVGFFDEVQDFTPLELKLVRKWGGQMERFILAGDDDQCHPAGVPVLTIDGYVMIEDLDPSKHRLVSYDRTSDEVVGLSDGRPSDGYSFEKTVRMYDDRIYEITAGGHTVRATRNHKWIVNWGSEISVLESHDLLSDLMLMPVHRGGSIVEWCSIQVDRTHGLSGPVYSLKVEPHPHYIASHIVTHNCLYNFKGATPDAFLNPQLPDEQKRVLSHSYRLRSKIHAFVERWVRTLSYREEKEYSPHEEGGEIVSFDQATFKNPAELVAGAAEHAEAGRTVLILAACSYMLVPAVRLMREQGIPFHNPYRRKRGDWNPLHPGRGASMVDRMFALLVPSREGRMWTNGELRLWVSLIDSKAGVLKRGAKELIKKVPDERVPDDELLRALFETEEFEKLLYQAEQEPLEWLASKMLKSKKKLMDFPMQIMKRYGVDALTAQPKITVGTIHSVKGGEADAVYIFPDLSKAGMLEWIGSPVQRDSVIRQFYVGFTRARHHLYLCGPESRMRVEFR